MSGPTQAWLDAASKPDARPILVFQFLQRGIYFASEAGHYPVAGFGEPHHAGLIDKGGMPVISRKIQNIFSGGTVTSIGDVKLIDNGSWDGFFGDHDATLRGERLSGYIIFPGLDFATDAVFYLDARVKQVTSSSGRLTLKLVDASAEWAATTEVKSDYTATLGDLVKTRLTNAGLTYPDDFDQSAWNAWTVAGKPGSFSVTGSWTDGDVFKIIDQLIRETLTWYSFGRDGKFYIEQFYDLGATPAVDIDLTDQNSLFEGVSIKTFDPVTRQQTVKYNNGTEQQEVRTVTLSPSHRWWSTAVEGSPKEAGLTLQADAAYLCDARLKLLSRERIITDVKADCRMLAFDLGDTVKLYFNEKHLPDVTPLYHRIVAIKENPNEGETLLTLWTDLGGPSTP